MTDHGNTFVGLIGAGQIGGPIAARLLGAGYELAVFDTNPKALEPLAAAGAVIAGSPLDVASRAETVLASLPTPQIVREAIIGAGAAAIKGKRIQQFIDLSTSGAALAAELARALAVRGVESLDAPVSGGPAGARAGKLTVMASGRRSLFDRVQPILSCLGRAIFVGEKPGSAQTLKLLNNLLSATAIAITSEAMTLGVKAGLDPHIMLEIISTSSGRNSAIEEKFPREVLTRRFDFGFSLGLSLKDVRLCIDEARLLGVPLMTGSVVCQLLQIARNTFGPNADCTTVARLVEEWGGCEISTTGAKSATPTS